jgi:transposase
MKHKSDDYKTVTVKYYLNNNNSMDEVCKIFKCKKSTLKDWVNKYKITKNLTSYILMIWKITLLYEIKRL